MFVPFRKYNFLTPNYYFVIALPTVLVPQDTMQQYCMYSNRNLPNGHLPGADGFIRRRCWKGWRI